MAQSERFYFWRGYYDALRKIPSDEQRGRFIMAVCAYAFDGKEPDLSDDPMLDIGWSLVADGSRESVRKGVEQSQRGALGGRPQNKQKSGAKSTAKSTALSTAKSGAKSEKKRREEKGSETLTLKGEGGGVAAAADAASLRPGETEAERIERVYGPQPDVTPEVT